MSESLSTVVQTRFVSSTDGVAARQELRNAIREKCVLSGTEHWLMSTSGTDLGWLIDMRQAFLDPRTLGLICNLFWDSYAKLLPFQVGGLEIAAIPLVVGLILAAKQRGFDVNGFIIRKERKPSGVGKVIEGRLDDSPIFLVDDIFNSGGSLEKAKVVLEGVNRPVSRAFTVIDYKSPRGQKWKVKHSLQVDSIFQLDDFDLSLGPGPASDEINFDVVWTFESPTPNRFHVVPKSAPLVVGELVIVGSDCGTLWALDAMTGLVRWSFQVGHSGRKGIRSRPTAAFGRIFFGAYDGNLYCLSIDDGRELWRSSCADWIGSSPTVSPRHGLLWIGLEHEAKNWHGSIAAFNLFTGEKVWEHRVPQYIHSTPAFSPSLNAVAVGCNDNHIYLLDALSGSLRWKFETQGAVKEAPLFDEQRGLLYAAGFDGLIRALDIPSGCEVWAVATQDSIYASLVLCNNKLVVPSFDKGLHIIDLARNSYSRLDLGSKSCCTPVVHNGRVLLGTNGGRLLDIDVDRCRVIGSKVFAEPLTCRMSVSQDGQTVFATTYVNQIYALTMRSQKTV